MAHMGWPRIGMPYGRAPATGLLDVGDRQIGSDESLGSSWVSVTRGSFPTLHWHREPPRLRGDICRFEIVGGPRCLIGHVLPVEECPRSAGADSEVHVLRQLAGQPRQLERVQPTDHDANDMTGLIKDWPTAVSRLDRCCDLDAIAADLAA